MAGPLIKAEPQINSKTDKASVYLDPFNKPEKIKKNVLR